MKTIAFTLMVLTAASAAQAHTARHSETYPAARAASFVGLQPSLSLINTPRPYRNDCNGGTCTLSGGPSGGSPDQN